MPSTTPGTVRLSRGRVDLKPDIQPYVPTGRRCRASIVTGWVTHQVHCRAPLHVAKDYRFMQSFRLNRRRVLATLVASMALPYDALADGTPIAAPRPVTFPHDDGPHAQPVEWWY